MITQQRTLQRLPIIWAAGLLGSALLLTGCSKNDNDLNSSSNNTTASQTNSIDDVAGDANKIGAKEAHAVANKPITTDSEIVSKDISPIAAAVNEPSILTNQTEVGTPENTVKLALDTLYYGDAERAATYYKVDMENFAEELKNTQLAFKQTVEGVTILDTKFNNDKTKATIIGELKHKGQKEPAPLTYELQKINGEWKILG